MSGVLADGRCGVLEKHYTTTEIAEALGISEKTVRRKFQDMPGAVRIPAASLLSKRRRAPRVILRIPESLLRRTYEDWSRGFAGKIQLRGGRV